MTEYESEGDNICPTCGEEFASAHGVKIHHPQAHGESIAGVEAECAWCGGVNRIERWEKERHENHFCDAECYGKWQSEDQLGENNPNWQGEGVEVECPWCGDEDIITPAKEKSQERFFCSRGCMGKWYSENLTGENACNWQGGDVVVECAWCGKEKTIMPVHARQNENHFCGHECRGKWLSENWVGEEHPSWQGGVFPYGPGWDDSKKESVRNRQSRRCAGCGAHESALPRKLDVHHIIPARKFDDPAERNDESNLIAMCQSCHIGRWEGIPLRPQTPHLD